MDFQDRLPAKFKSRTSPPVGYAEMFLVVHLCLDSVNTFFGENFVCSQDINICGRKSYVPPYLVPGDDSSVKTVGMPQKTVRTFHISFLD